MEQPHLLFTMSTSIEYFGIILLYKYICNACVLLQAAVWHCLNNYAYPDAIFLAERLRAEGMYE